MSLGPVRTGGYPEVSGNDVLGGRGRPAPGRQGALLGSRGRGRIGRPRGSA
jgi:hypothetical protein